MSKTIFSLRAFSAIGLSLGVAGGSFGAAHLMDAWKDNSQEGGLEKIKNPEEYLVDLVGNVTKIEGADGYSCKYTDSSSNTLYSDSCRLVYVSKAGKGKDTNLKHVHDLYKKVDVKDFGNSSFKHHSFKLVVDKDHFPNINMNQTDPEIELVYRSDADNEQSLGKFKLTHKYESGYYKGKVDSLLVRYKGSADVTKSSITQLRCSTTSHTDTTNPNTNDFNCLLNEMHQKKTTKQYDFIVSTPVATSITVSPNELFTMQPNKPSSSTTDAKVLNTESYNGKQNLYFKFASKETSTSGTDTTSGSYTNDSLAFELVGLVAHKKGPYQQPLMIREF